MAERDLQLKIQALIEGAQDVQELRDTLRALSQQQVKDNSKEFRGGLDASGVAAKGLNSSLRLLTVGLGSLGLAFSAVGILRFASQQLELADQLNTTAKNIDINVETLQEYRYAAEEAGVSTDVLDSAVSRFMRRTAQAAQGTGAARGALRELNIQLRDSTGNLRPVEELMDDVADAMAKIPSAADRNRLAFALFGREGVGLAEMLKDGSAAFRLTREQAHELGLVLSSETTQGAADAARELQKMRQVITAQFARVVVENADAFKDLAESVTEVAVAIAQFASERWSPLAKIQREMDGLIKRRDLLLDMRRKPSLFGRRPTEDIDREINEINDQLIQLQRERDKLQAERSTPEERDRPAVPEYIDIDDAAEKAAERQQQQIQAIIDRLQEQAATYGMAAEATALYRLEQLGANEAQMDAARTAAATTKVQRETDEAVRASAAAYAELQREIERNQDADAQLLQQMEREIELLGMTNRERAIAIATARLSVDATNEQREAVAQLAGELYDLAEASKNSSDQMSEFAKQAARNIQSVFAEFLFDPFDKGLKGMLRSFVEVTHRMVSEALSAQILQAFFGAMGGGAGGFFGTMAANVRHTGGLAGAGPTRQVPTALFVGAPRYHGGGIAGLAPDEVPAILRRGEEVLTATDPRHRDNGGGGGVSLRIVNVVDPRIAADYLTSSEGERVVMNLIQRNAPQLKQVLS